jgi:hypothetical protein
MDKKERIELIRKGNMLFNKGEIEKASIIFRKTGYRDGLTRIGDYYFYEKKQPLIALKYYKMVNKTEKVNEIFERMVFALGKWLGNDKVKGERSSQEVKLPPLKVSPKLKILAEEILKGEKGKK